MVTRVDYKRTELALQWNTKIEIAARLIIIGFTILMVFGGYFAAASAAMSYNHLTNITGIITHRQYEMRYVFAGLGGLAVGLCFFFVTGLPYLLLKRANSFKPWIIISFVLLTCYLIAAISIVTYFADLYSDYNKYTKIAYAIFTISFCLISLSYGLLWREVRKQWKIRKTFEYLNDKKKFEQQEEKIKSLAVSREEIIEESNIDWSKPKTYDIKDYQDVTIKKKKEHIYNQKQVVNEEKLIEVDLD